MTYDQPDKPYELLIEQDRAEEERQRKVEWESDRERTRRESKRAVDAEEDASRKIVATRASDVVTARPKWLWRDRVPLGGLSLLAGKGDTSKSTLFCQFAAWLTTGEMKGEFYGKPQTVLYVVNEDSLSLTVAPRLIAHGADMDRIFFIRTATPLVEGDSALMLPRDADALKRYIASSGAVVTFIDPLSANVSGRKNDQGDMRSTYQVVNNIAEETGTSIFGLAHTRKAGAADVVEAVIGSSEQTNVARAVLGLVMDKEEDGARILSNEKLNVGDKSALSSLRFTVLSVNVPTHDGHWSSQPQIQWLAETTDTASDMLSDSLYGDTGADKCAAWLKQYVTQNGGQVYSSDAREEGKKYSSTMLDRARKKAGIKSKRTNETPSRTVWYLRDIDPLT